MTLYIDPPLTPGHGTYWSHLISDESFDELHRFARQRGLPPRGFDRDHYDVPEQMYAHVVAAGATPVSARHITTLLIRSGLRRRKAQVLAPGRPGQRLVQPRHLRPGDVVAVVHPAGPVSPERLAPGVEVLQRWGLRVSVPAARDPGPLPWLAADDAARAEEFMTAWLDREVQALWAARGGFGSQRLLDLLDWQALRDAPPVWFIGFSDVTALHQAIAQQLGLASVHGPGVAGLAEADDATRESARSLLMHTARQRFTGRPGGGGRAEGVLVGGNLTMLAALAGSSYGHPARDSIAVLEDVGEQPYRLDRALTQLAACGWLTGVRGIALGQFVNCGDPALVRRLLERRLADLGVPVVYDIPFGHGTTNVALPLGRRARLDADLGTVELLG